MQKWIRATRDRADLVALGVLALTTLLLPGGVPGGVYGLGLVAGAVVAMHAVGIVLTYRANRIVNFSQVQVAVVAGVLFRLMVEQQTLLRGLRAVCEPCAPGGSAGRTLTYWGSALVAVGAAVAVTFLIEAVIVRRFADAPRLVLTVATIGVAQLLASVHAALPGLMATAEQRELSQLPAGTAAPPPLDWSLRVDPAVFRAPEILTLVVAVLAIGALFAWITFTTRGVAIRASAENRQRAATLGIDTGSAQRRVWLAAGALAGLAGVLVAMTSPMPAPSPLDVSLAVRILAAAVIASMISLPLAAVAALVLGVFDQAMVWVTGSSAITDGALTAVVAGVLLLRRYRASRVEEELAGAWRAAREARPLPPALAALESVKRARRGLVGALAGVLFALPFILSPTQANVWTIALVYGMVAMSLLIVSGWSGQISLGQFAVAGVGGYVAALAGGSVPMVLALVVGALGGAVAAIVVGIPALKMRGLNLAITTLAVALAVSALLLSPAYGGRLLPETLPRGAVLGIDVTDHRAFYYFTLVLLAGVVVATAGLRRSRLGRALLASRDNEAAAASFGIDVVRARVTGNAIAGAFAGLAGAVFVYHQYGLKAASFTPDVSVSMFLMAIIGGLGSIAGALSGAAYLGVLTLLSVSPMVLFLATGGGVLVLLLWAPGGIGGLLFDLRDTGLRRLARRHGIDVPALFGRRLSATDDRAPIAPRLDTAPVERVYRLEDERVEVGS